MRYIIFVFFGATLLGYTQEYEVLKGNVTTAILKSEAIHVVNQTQNIGVITNQVGEFEIKATIGDVIIFSSIQYVSKKHIVLEDDLNHHVEIRLEPLVNELDEVVLSQYTLTGTLEDDLQKIPTYTDNLPFWNAAELKQMGVATFNDAQSPVHNLALESSVSQAVRTSIDFNQLVSSIANLFIKDKSPVLKIEITNFLSEKIIIEQLDIPETEYYNFVDFVNEQSDLAIVLSSKDELKILEYLINQSEVFKEKYNVKK